MELQIIQSKIYEIRGQKVTEEEFEHLDVAICDIKLGWCT